MRANSTRFMMIRHESTRRMTWNMRWWAIQNRPITAKVRAKPANWPALARMAAPTRSSGTSGMRMPKASSVMAMANTASEKKTTRSTARPVS